MNGLNLIKSNVGGSKAIGSRNIWKMIGMDYFDDVSKWSFINTDGTAGTAWTVSGNVLTAPVAGGTFDAIASFNNVKLNDGRVSVILENIADVITGNASWAGIFLRGKTKNDGIIIVVKKDVAAGKVVIYRAVGGSYTLMTSADFSTTDTILASGIPVALDVEMIGNQCKVYVNGRLMLASTDPTFLSYMYGTVGLVASRSIQPTFSNFMIKQKTFDAVISNLKNVICIGSSITYGAGTSTGGNSSSWANRFGANLMSKFGASQVNLINKGVSGNTTTQMLARFDTDVVVNNPDLVVIEASVNDVRGDMLPINYATTIGNLRTMIKKTKQAGAIPILTTPTPITTYSNNVGSGFGINSARPNCVYAQKVRQLAIEEDIILVDNMLNFGNDGTLLGDGVHPNDIGAQKMADHMLNVLLGKN